MSDYGYPTVPNNITFGARDDLAPGNAEKVVKGSQMDAEFNGLVTSVNSKLDKNAAPGSFTGTIDGGVIDGGTY